MFPCTNPTWLCIEWGMWLLLNRSEMSRNRWNFAQFHVWPSRFMYGIPLLIYKTIILRGNRSNQPHFVCCLFKRHKRSDCHFSSFIWMQSRFATNTLTKRLPLPCHLMRNNVRNCSRSTIMCYSKHKTSSNNRARWIVCRDQTSKRFEESIMLWIEWRCCRFTFLSIVRTQCVGFIVRSVISTELSCDHLCQSVSRCLCVIFIITCICNRTFVAFFLTDT